MISKDKRITPEVIADTLGEEVGTIKRVITNLTDKGFLDIKEVTIGEGIDSNIEIQRILTEPLGTIIEKIKPITREFLIRYSYEWKPQFAIRSEDKSTTPLMDSSRPLYNKNRSSQAGGLWTKKGTNTHSESCRHRWVSNIVTRK